MALQRNILVINCGSSSVKFQVVDPFTKVRSLAGIIDRLNTPKAVLKLQQGNGHQHMSLGNVGHLSAIGRISDLVTSNIELAGIGHRVVHGGDIFKEAVKITRDTKEAIKSLSHLAPMHNPNNLMGIELLEKKFSHLPQVAVFDTTFHVKSMPEKAFRYAVPEQWLESHKVRRYGFHGMSHKYVAGEFANLMKKPVNEVSVISAHLGNGCSMCAIKDGKSVDTSMGFTPLEGLIMGTRSGDLDASVISYMAQRLSCSADEVLSLLLHKSGLEAISGYHDSRDIEKKFKEGDKRAALAIEMFCYRIAKYLAAYVVPLRQIPDGIIFTGGIGERSPLKRKLIIDLLQPIGFKIDDAENMKNSIMISSNDSTGAIAVIPTNEELVIAQETINAIMR